MKAVSEYRNVSDSEVQLLISQNCSSDNWSEIKIKPQTDLTRCRNSRFTGKIKLGLFNGSFTDDSGVHIHSGIVNAHIHNCLIGDNVTIYYVSDYIANYHIEDNVVIRNCGRIQTEGLTSFGNGTNVAVLNETGKRAVKIWDRLSAQQAYILALYRHRIKAIDRIEEMISDYAESVTSETGTIGQGSKIYDSVSIRNVRIGPYSSIEGAIKLYDGSINSCSEDPVHIGYGVIMEHFIISSGSEISDSSLVNKCFIGQGCVLSKNFSAEHSLFFANSECYLGEACSLFAGPYTVTHHKSTLLIAGMFSFMNAGSGSNQSNHMYKLGPVHQGIIERGCKTASDSYLQWPAHIGPFTLIKGRHYNNADTSLFPFSYLIENKEESYLVPGISLRSVGTIRDSQKWPLRDARKDPVKFDKICFNLLNPFTVRKMIAGRDILIKLGKDSAGTDVYIYKGMKIRRSSLERGIDLYRKGIDIFLGNSLVKRLEATEFANKTDLIAKLSYDKTHGTGEWSDLAGLFIPVSEVDLLLDGVEKGKVDSLEGLNLSFDKAHKSYDELEWSWAASTLEEEEKKPFTGFGSSDVIRIVQRWEKSVIDLDNLLIEDAKKEFSISAMTGFGIDGNETEKKHDFEQVRGAFESNPVVRYLMDHIKTKSAQGEELIERIKKIR